MYLIHQGIRRYDEQLTRFGSWDDSGIITNNLGRTEAVQPF
jgi:hypothetical protein